MTANDNSQAVEADLLAALAGAASTTDPTQFRRTDAGNAQLFVTMFSENLRYVEPWKTWLFWNGNMWGEVSDIALTPLATQATEHMFQWAAGLPDEDRDNLRKHAMASQKKSASGR